MVGGKPHSYSKEYHYKYYADNKEVLNQKAKAVNYKKNRIYLLDQLNNNVLPKTTVKKMEKFDIKFNEKTEKYE